MPKEPSQLFNFSTHPFTHCKLLESPRSTITKNEERVKKNNSALSSLTFFCRSDKSFTCKVIKSDNVEHSKCSRESVENETEVIEKCRATSFIFFTGFNLFWRQNKQKSSFIYFLLPPSALPHILKALNCFKIRLMCKWSFFTKGH